MDAVIWIKFILDADHGGCIDKVSLWVKFGKNSNGNQHWVQFGKKNLTNGNQHLDWEHCRSGNVVNILPLLNLGWIFLSLPEAAVLNLIIPDFLWLEMDWKFQINFGNSLTDLSVLGRYRRVGTSHPQG